MTEALISNLAQIRALKVISRTSVMRYKGSAKSLPEIARELSVDAILEGSVQGAGGRVRVTTQLVHATTDTNLWARNYERALSDVLRLEGEVVREVAEEIRSTSPPMNGPGWLRPTASIPKPTKPIFSAGIISGKAISRAENRPSNTSSARFSWLRTMPPPTPGCPMRGCNEASSRRTLRTPNGRRAWEP
jgi:hypothetical protein